MYFLRMHSLVLLLRFLSSSSFGVLMAWWPFLGYLHITLKAPNKNCSRQHFNFLLLSFEENKLDFSCEFSHLKQQVLFSLKNNEKIFMNVICCSRDWRFKG